MSHKTIWCNIHLINFWQVYEILWWRGNTLPWLGMVILQIWLGHNVLIKLVEKESYRFKSPIKISIKEEIWSLMFCCCGKVLSLIHILLRGISKWRVAIKEPSLSDSKRCSVSKVTTHLHCSHGHHIYHLVHGIHWLANQRRITHGDVRRAGLRLSHTQQKHHDCCCHTWQEPGETLTDTTIDGVSMAWPVGAWHEVCIKQTCWPRDVLF